MTTVTDWRYRDEDLLEIEPGEAVERVITPQKPVVLCAIEVRDLRLVRLRIGAVDRVPFELTTTDGPLKIYRPHVEVAWRSDVFGAKVVAHDEIWVPAGMDVRVVVHNDTDAPAKPLAALLVREEK